MISEDALREAIKECLEERNPNASTCIKLASFYTILDHVREWPSGASGGPQTEFRILADKIPAEDLIGILDGLMTALEAKCPRLYDATMARLRERA